MRPDLPVVGGIIVVVIIKIVGVAIEVEHVE
jgi:hypothetical protein